MTLRTVPQPDDNAAEPTLRDVLVELRLLRGLIEQALPAAPPRSWLTVGEAASLAGKSEQALSGWCRRHRIGVKIRNAWRVDREQLRRLLIERFGEDRLPSGLH